MSGIFKAGPAIAQMDDMRTAGDVMDEQQRIALRDYLYQQKFQRYGGTIDARDQNSRDMEKEYNYRQADEDTKSVSHKTKMKMKRLIGDGEVSYDDLVKEAFMILRNPKSRY